VEVISGEMRNENVFACGDTLEIFGLNTHFAQGVSVVSFTPAVLTPSSVTVSDITHLSLSVSNSALISALTPLTVTVTTGGEVVSHAMSVSPCAG
jgi:hypothetical protein